MRVHVSPDTPRRPKAPGSAWSSWPAWWRRIGGPSRSGRASATDNRKHDPPARCSAWRLFLRRVKEQPGVSVGERFADNVAHSLAGVPPVPFVESSAGIDITPTGGRLYRALSQTSAATGARGPPVIRLTFVGAMSCSRNHFFRLNAMVGAPFRRVGPVGTGWDVICAHAELHQRGGAEIGVVGPSRQGGALLQRDARHKQPVVMILFVFRQMAASSM